MPVRACLVLNFFLFVGVVVDNIKQGASTGGDVFQVFYSVIPIETQHGYYSIVSKHSSSEQQGGVTIIIGRRKEKIGGVYLYDI